MEEIDERIDGIHIQHYLGYEGTEKKTHNKFIGRIKKLNV